MARGKSQRLEREIADALASFEVGVSKLYAWRPKLEETVVDVNEGRLSHATGKPLRVSRLDSPRGAYAIIDGHHRAVEAVRGKQPTVRVEIDRHVPRIERAGGAYQSYVSDKVNVADFVKRHPSSDS